jgi:hypothetical protein
MNVLSRTPARPPRSLTAGGDPFLADPTGTDELA